ncbi:hypothetical protein TNCV_1682561 [Trichonephila clavipes]|nr:hypothetical protein TNCV_1682561 [Trichonephila clavipes]
MWSMIVQRLIQITPPAAIPDQLWQTVEAAWSAEPQEYIQSIFESMPRSVAAISGPLQIIKPSREIEALRILREVLNIEKAKSDERNKKASGVPELVVQGFGTALGALGGAVVWLPGLGAKLGRKAVEYALGLGEKVGENIGSSVGEEVKKRVWDYVNNIKGII